MDERKSNKTILTIIGLVIIAVIVVIIVILVRSKSPSNTSKQSLTPAQTGAAKAQIETNWKTFFAASTSLQDREKLLQNGSKFSQPIQTEFAALSSQKSSAVISSISLTSPESADVLYAVELNGQPVLSNQKGQAQLINNSWEVSDATLCGLLSMGGNHPSVCQNL